MRESTNTAGGRRGGRAFCEQCLTYGGKDVLLRICLSCGHVGCAEGSPRDHAAAHYAETDHPIAAAIGSPAPHWNYPEERPV
jgi:uncharacterized UBP type Zn finger protein